MCDSVFFIQEPFASACDLLKAAIWVLSRALKTEPAYKVLVTDREVTDFVGETNGNATEHNSQ